VSGPSNPSTSAKTVAAWSNETPSLTKFADALTGSHSPAGRIVSSLEGGYNLDALGACVVAHLEPMLRMPFPAAR
jgi:acetoin utilization deacetylase AcuC-like enzyme